MKRLPATKSPWGESQDDVEPWLYPHPHGDGKKLVCLSFFEAPDFVLYVPVDTDLPLELDSDHPRRYRERREGEPVICFRDLLDGIYEELEELLPLSDWTRELLRDECEDELAAADVNELS